MESLDFVKLAVSKDKLRPNLTSVYRDISHFVATDGHRLHYSNGLPTLEKGHFVNGIDADFIKWDSFIPANDPVSTVTLKVDRITLKQLTAFEVIAKTLDRSVPCKITTTNGNLRITLYQKSVINCILEIPCDLTGPDIDTDMGLNLSYVMDVFKSATLGEKYALPINIKFYSELAPWLFEVEKLGNAVIMPLHLK